MNVALQIRQDMLQVLRDSIMDSGVDESISRKIVFYNASDDVLCEVPFSDMIDTSQGNEATYKFEGLAAIDQDVLRGTVVLTGTPVAFRIYGKVEAGDIPVMSGTVRSLAESGDMRFNSVAWQAGQIVTLSNMRISLN